MSETVQNLYAQGLLLARGLGYEAVNDAVTPVFSDKSAIVPQSMSALKQGYNVSLYCSPSLLIDATQARIAAVFARDAGTQVIDNGARSPVRRQADGSGTMEIDETTITLDTVVDQAAFTLYAERDVRGQHVAARFSELDSLWVFAPTADAANEVVACYPVNAVLAIAYSDGEGPGMRDTFQYQEACRLQEKIRVRHAHYLPVLKYDAPKDTLLPVVTASEMQSQSRDNAGR